MENYNYSEVNDWENAWKQWSQVKRLNEKAGTKTITIGDTITITVPASEDVVIKDDTDQ
tara:strand:- start:336 stop:512 length:177 start_codon:yes stop_codon:yes gene_type:complete